MQFTIINRNERFAVNGPFSKEVKAFVCPIFRPFILLLQIQEVRCMKSILNGNCLEITIPDLGFVLTVTLMFTILIMKISFI